MEESFDFVRIQEQISYVLDNFSISISVRSFVCCLAAVGCADCFYCVYIYVGGRGHFNVHHFHLVRP